MKKPTAESNLTKRRTRVDEIRQANRTCIDESELGALYLEGLALLEIPVRLLVQLLAHPKSDNRLKVLAGCNAAVYDLALAGFDVIEDGHLTLIPAVTRDIYEWSVLFCAAISDDSISAKLMNDTIDWKDQVAAAKLGCSHHIDDLLKDWGAASGLVHHQKSIAIKRFFSKGMDEPFVTVGANLSCRRTLGYLFRLCRGIGNHLLLLRNWDGLVGLSDQQNDHNTDDAWREAIDQWRLQLEDESKYVPSA